MSKPSSSSPPADAALPVFDTSALTVTYVNYHRAAGTADELVLDFGMQTAHQTPDGPEPIALTQRLVMPWAHARRLAQTLAYVLQVHDTRHAQPNRPPQPPAPAPKGES